MLKKTVGNWVDGDRFFNREDEIAALREHVQDGTHTLLTAQRRMGKTSLVRELLRVLNGNSGIKTCFVDLEDARDPADAIVEISVASRSLRSIRRRALESPRALFAKFRNIQVGGQYEEMRFHLRADIHVGNWRRKGDRLLRDLTRGSDLVVLAIDELPLLINRILKGRSDRQQPENVAAADEFLSWLRRNAQEHRGRLCFIVSGSVGIAPILRRVGLSAAMNVFSNFELKPWSRSTAAGCLEALAASYHVHLPREVRDVVCDRLRSCIPHHVQQFFDALHRHLRIARRSGATLEDADRAYREDMLGARGRIDMDHYEDRLKLVLGRNRFTVALELLARAAAGGLLGPQSIEDYSQTLDAADDPAADSLPFVLDVLEQDGYFDKRREGYCFASGLLEDWQRARQGLPIHPLSGASVSAKRTA